MNEFVKGLCNQCGINEKQANEVISYLKAHADEVPQWLGKSGVSEKLGSAASKLGIGGGSKA